MIINIREFSKEIHPTKGGGQILRKGHIWGGNSLGLFLLGHKPSDPGDLQSSNVSVDTCYFLGSRITISLAIGTIPKFMACPYKNTCFAPAYFVKDSKMLPFLCQV